MHGHAPPPWTREHYLSRGEVCGYSDGSIRTAFHLGSGILNMLDAPTNTALFWVRNPASIPDHETTAPLRAILYWWMRDHARQFVHAAAVGTAEAGVLLAGKGGTGKSTTAVCCLSAGFRYAGDDYVLLSDRPGPFVHSLYSSAKLDGGALEKLPHLMPAVRSFEKGNKRKALLFLHSRYPERIATGFPIQAILLPHITGSRGTTLRKASPAAVLRALAPSTIFQLPGAGRETFQCLAGFVKHVPGYVLELGTDPTRIPEAVREVLEGVGP